MALPVAKLALMGLKIVTKPIANQVKSQAKQHPAFKEMCISLGRTINSMTVWANNKMLSRCVFLSTLSATALLAPQLLKLNAQHAGCGIICRTPAEGTKRFVLNEQQAIERGADAVGELATFFLIGIPVVGIYWSEAEEKNRAKEEARIAKEVRAARCATSPTCLFDTGC